MADVVTFGEAMIRLTPPGFQRIEQATSLEMTVGGSEFNVACDLGRLEISSSWVSALPRNPFGFLVRNKAREQGVDVSGIAFTDEGRVGKYFVEYGSSPRASRVIYDRENAVVASYTGYDWDRLFTGARWFHTSGITPALSSGCAEETEKAIRTAKKAGLTVSYDLNYRAKLWKPEEAQKATRRYVSDIDVCVGNEEDFQKVLGVDVSGERESFESVDVDYYRHLAGKVAETFGFRAVGISLRESHSVLRNGWKGLLHIDGNSYVSREYDLEIVDRVGGGDSFSAGIIRSMLLGKGPQEGVEFAAAFSALKHTVWGDVNIVTESEVSSLLKSGGTRIER